MSKANAWVKGAADHLLYFLIAFLGAWQLSNWEFHIEAIGGALLLGLTTLKAKRSRSKGRDE